MFPEGQKFDKKSLRALDDMKELSKDCIAFANANGGDLIIGMEDSEDAPSPTQKISEDQITKFQKRIGEITIGLQTTAFIQTHENGGQYIVVHIERNPYGPASTTDGQYFIRDGDKCRPLRPDELSRFITDRPAFDWEVQKTDSTLDDIDKEKYALFLNKIRESDRITEFVKRKSEEEVLEHYFFVRDGFLTNLGALCVGTQQARGLLSTAPIIQVIKKDERDQKVLKKIWDDYSLAPWEMVDEVIREIPDWKESYELPDGMFRKNIAVYDELVVRELLVNAIVHRPYTHRGDIFINLYSDRMEIHNPGSLPIGVTPENILHKSIKRNEKLAKVFHDLKLMEREGSGYDLIYEVLLSAGKAPPIVRDDNDRVVVTVFKKIIDSHIIAFVQKADETFQLNQKERICLGLIAQKRAINGMQLTKELKLENASTGINSWLGRLIDLGLVNATGKTRGKTYSIEPSVLRSLDFKGKTTLGTIPPHRLRELILEDLRIHREASISEIRSRVGNEVPVHVLRQMLFKMIDEGLIDKKGELKHRRYLHK